MEVWWGLQPQEPIIYPTVDDPASALTFATMHRDELIAEARARRQVREATQVRRANRPRRRLIH